MRWEATVGRVLQIRVSASTFNPDDLDREWPVLVSLGFTPPVILEQERGVLQLVENLADRLDMGVLPEEAARDLGDFIRKAAAAKERLEAALAEWNARLANQCSDEIEQALDDAEKTAGKRKDYTGRS